MTTRHGAIANEVLKHGRCLTMERYDVREIASRMGVNVVRTPLKCARGYTNGYDTIWVHDGLTEAEERSTICHELIHVTFGHVGEQPPEVEAEVRKGTARWLVPWWRLAEAWVTGRPVECIAEELAVTPEVVLDRITYATPQELWMLEERDVTCDWLAA